MALIKDLISIPERVHQGDFVLKLSEGVQHAEQTLRDYVVTPQLVAAFDNALAFIKSAVETRAQQGRLPARQFRLRQEPLHGGAAPAPERQRAGALDHRACADVVARHNAWTRGQASSSRAVSHDRRATTWSRRSSAGTPSTSASSIRTLRCRAST